MSRRRLAVGLIAGVLSAALVRASSQAPAAVTQPQPVFRVGVDVVRIDAVVTDKDGRVVTDLTAKDFELRQDGKVQNITLARFVPVVDVRGPAHALAAACAEERRARAAAAACGEAVQGTGAALDRSGG